MFHTPFFVLVRMYGPFMTELENDIMTHQNQCVSEIKNSSTFLLNLRLENTPCCTGQRSYLPKVFKSLPLLLPISVEILDCSRLECIPSEIELPTGQR